MHRNLSKYATVALIAAIGIGVPALDAYGSVGRAPTFAVPNPNNPSLTGGGSTGYNANLYIY